MPCRYLGLPLGFRKPVRGELQRVLDKAAGKLLPRKGLVLINSVVTATATYFLTAFLADKWIIKKMDKLSRSVVWGS